MENLTIKQRKEMISKLAGDDIHVLANVEITGTVFAKSAANSIFVNTKFKNVAAAGTATTSEEEIRKSREFGISLNDSVSNQ